MKRRVIFRKLVDGYKAQTRWKLDDKTYFKGIIPSFDKPIEITGEVSIRGQEKIKLGELKGVEIPEFDKKRPSKFGIGKDGDFSPYQATYPLIPSNPSKDEPIMAYAKVQWNSTTNRYEYLVIEPQIPPKVRRLIDKLKEILEEKLDVDFTKLKKQEAKDYLKREAFKLLDYFGLKISEIEKTIITYYIEKNFLGLGPIEPLFHDPNIEDISCDGVNIPIYVFHQNPSVGSVQTNIVFKDPEELDSFVMRLAQLCGQSISVLDPLLDGSLPDGSRVQATLSTDIARRGSNFTIRKFREVPLSLVQLINYRTTDVRTLAFLWMAVDYGCSILVSGGTATGKTVFLNVLSSFIRPEMKIVSIEDTAELKLHHPHWIPHVSRTSISTEVGKEMGQIDLFDLLKESLRQRPDYIIVGEVRGQEAYVLFQQMATGHPSFATIHADTIEKLIDRLTTPPINLSPSLIESLDLIVFLSRLKYKGKFTRKLQAIYEISGFDREKNIPITSPIFEWDAEDDKIKSKNPSITLRKITIKTGMSEKELVEEFKRRMNIINWLVENNITDNQTITQVINLYYSYPERVIDVISGGL
ncbi:MAG: type II/IV secretion system ATPase subunit [Candidatus Aenigmatarchaeota archaeon]